MLGLGEAGEGSVECVAGAFPVVRISPPDRQAVYENHTDFSSHDFSERVGIDFSGFKFGAGANFYKTKFGLVAKFVNTEWGDDCDFSETHWLPGPDFTDASWGNRACFRSARWEAQAKFLRAEWGDEAEFRCATFGDQSTFQLAQWGTGASFKLVLWGVDTNFIDACWHGNVEYQWAHWGRRACFENAHWLGKANFQGAQFGDDANFLACTWEDDVDFSASSWDLVPRSFYDHPVEQKQITAIKDQAQWKSVSPDCFSVISFAGSYFKSGVDFTNRKFKSKANFGVVTRQVKRNEKGVAMGDDGKLSWEEKQEPARRVEFGLPPVFHGCEIHQSIKFDEKSFPAARYGRGRVDSYRTLKQFFNKQQDLKTELLLRV